MKKSNLFTIAVIIFGLLFTLTNLNEAKAQVIHKYPKYAVTGAVDNSGCAVILCLNTAGKNCDTPGSVFKQCPGNPELTISDN